MSFRKSILAGASAALLALTVAACGNVPTATAPITGASNTAQIAAEALALCQGACGMLANSATASDIQTLVTAYLSAGAYTTASIIANAICATIKATPTLALRAHVTAGHSVTVQAPNGQSVIVHFDRLR